MVSICFYFQVHQPFRIRKYSIFDIGQNRDYFEEKNNLKLNNEAVLRKVANKCYLPANKLMLELINKHPEFRISYSMSGTALEQFEKYYPEVTDSFMKLVDTGRVELLSETYHHSLAYLYSKKEFKEQVALHKEKLWGIFSYKPKVFRNTELIYNNELASFIEGMGYKGIICEGVDKHLNGRTPNFIYRAANTKHVKLLLKNYLLSDDIAFRFSDKGWKEFPLTADKFKNWIHNIAGNGETINLFMDYETFGEHQWESTGIFNFLDKLPEEILKHPDFDFKTPSEVISSYPARDIYDVPDFTSWADTERDLSAWLSNSMQIESIKRIYSIEKDVLACEDPALLKVWEKLQTSDHYYYMCTKFWNDGDVHKYFSPFESPYDAYMYFMNVFSDLESSIKDLRKKLKKIPRVKDTWILPESIAVNQANRLAMN